MSKKVTVTVFIAKDAKQNIVDIATQLGVGQFELVEALFEMASANDPRLIEKVKSIKIKNAEAKYKRRKLVAKLEKLSDSELERLVEKLK